MDVAVRARARTWLAAAVSAGSFDAIDACAWSEASARARLSPIRAPDDIETRTIDAYQAICISVALALHAGVVSLDEFVCVAVDEFVCEALVYAENRFVKYGPQRLACILAVVRAGLLVDLAVRAEAALYAAHASEMRLYALHASKLARAHTVCAIQAGHIDPEDAWHVIDGVTAEHDEHDVVPANTLLQCPRCKENRVSYYQRQTRSADEPLTTFASCCHVPCKYRWKF